ncbi:MAG TPA: ATP-binding cassette domain-containing protein [Puia sp.]|jgi:ABC-type multidrug transport system ATPase subunit|nr:ATP-binding cassette domain-containing protein [Puia sp.]
MKITLIDAGKRFNRDWIFRHLQYEFLPQRHYAITGPNGSGKSTLLQLIAGAIGISEGSVRYTAGSAATAISRATAMEGSAAIPPDQAYRYLSLSAPYLDLIEEMTATEFLRFHHSFKPILPALTIPDALAAVGLAGAAQKQIRFFSSGMKQRLKLAQALFSDTSVILLDEPCTNLDAEGIALYQRLIRQYGEGRLVVVSSNDPQEYDFCEERIDIRDYK